MTMRLPTIPGEVFYVYTLTDPRDCHVFYVGKGQRSRAWEHTRDVRQGRRVSNVLKTERIAGILAADMEPTVTIVASFADERAAVLGEAELIATLPALTNIRARDGSWALAPSEFERRAVSRRDRRAEARRRRIDLARKAESVRTREYLTQWLRKVDMWPDVTFPNIADGDRKAREFVDMVRKLVALPVAAQPI